MLSKCRLSSLVVLVVLASVVGATPAISQVPSGTGSGSSGASMRPPERPSWGGSDRVLYAVGFSEFTPSHSGVTYSDLGPSIGRFATPSLGSFYATPHVPSGVLLTYLELDYCDNTSANVLLTLMECSYLGDPCNPIGTVSSGDGPAGCNFVSTVLNHTIDNNVKRLFLFAVTASGDSLNILVGAYIGYKLQVSPAPASATFLDVQPNHPFFRFVEALSRSGITAGCGGNNYCVNEPITRGEMAVFLSVALGLHFPN